MNNLITPRQKELLSIVYSYIKNEGYPPTFDEMRKKLKIVSNQSVIDLLNKLVEGKFLKRNENIARSIAILPLGYEALGKPPLAPFLGVTTAGFPIDPIEMTGEWQELPGGVARFADQVFLLKVHGDSMINAGINDGDVVLVKSEKEFSSGDIVLAEVSGESTIKRFVSEDKPPYLYLKPENPEYKIIYFTEEVVLKGKVLSVVKQGQMNKIA
ncbi:repressor LexA [Candidatus Roizmanbacteria bacterium RIFCSPLOWO2_01_FULL_41_22]|uniref:Repressor LexA n=2 Tax=Candidatus Roizmaniibacteriota TaxID=1752723 RepID=A0A1F7JS44_9BACT|nr:MAG: repressor LexA [Candidatus Roizmanbacteria bacterium RIFCSPLOWO2_01_FULL_41_22]OGK58434.1 MAG: repressor LexA [Candidatus Roizmanbacteria bacterium RIFCSPLOWO2_02_FULL_41_9]